MANELSNEWSRVSSVAQGVRTSRQRIRQAESEIAAAEAAAEAAAQRASQAEAALASLPVSVSYDDDGSEQQHLEQQRAMYEAEAASARAAQSEAENRASYARGQLAQAQQELSAYQSEASSLAGSYEQMASQYQQKQQTTAQAGAQFHQLAGMRFGSAAASAGANLTDQRSAHYQSMTDGYHQLAQAASAAGDGVMPSGGAPQVADRGSYSGGVTGGGAGPAHAAHPASAGASGAGGGGSRAQRMGTANTGGSRAQRLGAAALSAAAVTAGISKAHAVSLSSLPMTGQTAAQAEQSMANYYGMSLEDYRAFQQENGMTLATDGSTVQMVQRQELGMDSLRPLRDPERGPELLDRPGISERGPEGGHFSSVSTGNWDILTEGTNSSSWQDIDPGTYFQDVPFAGGAQNLDDPDIAVQEMFGGDDDIGELPQVMSMETKLAVANRNSGVLDWSGSEGNSMRVPKDSSSAVAQELRRYGVSGIVYTNGDVDFSPVARYTFDCGNPENTYYRLGEDIKIGDLYTEKGSKTRAGFNQIIRKKWQKQVAEDIVERLHSDSAFAADLQQRTGIEVSRVNSVSALSKQLKRVGLTMHETPDCRSIQFVPTLIHDTFKHSGGTAEMLEKLIDGDTRGRVESLLGI